MSNELTSTTTVPLSAPLQQQGHPSTQDAQRSAINQALALLKQEQRESMPNIELTQQKGRISGGQLMGGQGVQEGHTAPGDPNIYVTPWSDTYKDAQKGNPDALKKLASVLEHEQRHITDGPDEGGAYDTQIAILKQLNAPAKMVESVRAAKDQVTGKTPK